MRAVTVVVVVALALAVAGVVGGCGLINAFSAPESQVPPGENCVDAAAGPCRCDNDGGDVSCVDPNRGCVCSDDGKAACAEDADFRCLVTADNNCSTAGCRCEDGRGDASCACTAGATCRGTAGDDRSESDIGTSCRGNCACDASGCNCLDFDCFANVDGESCGDDDDCIRSAARTDLSSATCNDDGDCAGAAGLICAQTSLGQFHCMRGEPCAPADSIDSIAHVVDGSAGADINVCITTDAREYDCDDGTCVFGAGGG